jgi:hypothetical protein
VMSMGKIKRVAAVLIAISLFLPQRSCVKEGKNEILYPLSEVDLGWQILLVALFVLPLILLFIFKKERFASILSRIVIAAIGLYLVSYGAYVLATKLLIGWYIYTVGASIYLVISLVELYKKIVHRKS